MFYLLGASAGALAIVSMIISSRLAEKTGQINTLLIHYSIGLISILGFILVVPTNLSVSVQGTSWWMYIGGLFGILIVGTANIVIPKLPVIISTLLIASGQVVTGVILEYFVKGTVSIYDISGGLLVIAGLSLNSIIDKAKNKKLEAVPQAA